MNKQKIRANVIKPNDGVSYSPELIKEWGFYNVFENTKTSEHMKAEIANFLVRYFTSDTAPKLSPESKYFIRYSETDFHTIKLIKDRSIIL